jgi:phosphohistidine phosphatase
MKTVTAVRHAKSDWSTGRPDVRRPLNKRGKKDAPEMGSRIAAWENRPGLLLSSPATRAHNTARLIARALRYPENEIALDEDLYGATARTMYDVLSGLPATVEHVAFFTHNPGITEFVNTVAAAHVENVPTCGVATFEFDISDWSEIAPAAGRMVNFDYPKKPRR